MKGRHVLYTGALFALLCLAGGPLIEGPQPDPIDNTPVEIPVQGMLSAMDTLLPEQRVQVPVKTHKEELPLRVEPMDADALVLPLCDANGNPIVSKSYAFTVYQSFWLGDSAG